MSTIDAALEPRSDEESDAGSLVDFICDDEEVGSEEEEETPVTLLTSSFIENGVRRSTRCRRQPARYLDPHYIDLMTDDVDIEEVLQNEDDTSKVDDESEDFSDQEESSSEEESEEASEEASEDFLALAN